MDDIKTLRVYYGAMGGLLDGLVNSNSSIASDRIVKDYGHIFDQVNKTVAMDLSFLAPDKLLLKNYGHDGSRDMNVNKVELISKIQQLKGILEKGFNVTDKIVQIGSLFNSIKDEKLRSRCADLLTANDHFDRVVNQATQVLEDRIRQKSGSSKAGKQLINETIKPDISSSILVLSSDKNEHEGYSHILRGIMQTLRNSTHHSLSSRFSREDSFAVCGYIDQLLRVIDRATVKS